MTVQNPSESGSGLPEQGLQVEQSIQVYPLRRPSKPTLPMALEQGIVSTTIISPSISKILESFSAAAMLSDHDSSEAASGFMESALLNELIAKAIMTNKGISAYLRLFNFIFCILML